MPRNANKDKLSNYSIEFNGSNSIITCGNLSQLQGATSASFSMWLNVNSTGIEGLFNQWGTGTDRLIFSFIWVAQGRLDIYLNDGIRFRVSGNSIISSLSTGEWFNLVITYDGAESTSSQRVKAYINNQELTGNVFGGPTSLYSSTTDFVIGTYPSGTYFDGKMSQVCIFDYALSTDQRTYLYNLNNPMVITGAEPIAYLPLGDNSNPNSPGSFPNISVKAGSVFNFNGSDLISTGTTLTNLDVTTSFSISLWVNISTNGIYDTIIGAPTAYATWNTGFGIILNSSGIRFWVEQWNGANQFVETSSLNNGQWYHVVATFDTTNGLKLYVNAATPTTATGTTIDGLTNEIFIGSSGTNTTYGLFGDLSNIQIWNTELSSSDINTLYNNGQPLMTGAQPQTDNLKVWYKLNQSANWEADTAGEWQIPDNRSAYPQSFDIPGATNAFIDGGNNFFTPYITSPNRWAVGTISFWLNTAETGYNGLLNSSSGWILRFDNQSAQRFFWLTGAGNNYVAWSGVTIADSKWHHIALVMPSGSDKTQAKLYIDNELINVAIVAGTNDGTGGNMESLVLGADRVFSGTGNKFSNFTFHNIAFNDAQIETLYNNGVPLTTQIETNNLKAWYKLDNTEVFNNPTIGTANWYVNNNANSTAYNSALKFVNSENDSVDVADSSSLKIQEQITICAWVNLDNYSNYTNVIDKQWDGAARSYVFRVYGRKPQFLLGNASGSAWTTANSSSILDYNEWYFLAAVYDGSEMKIYINGTLDGTPVSKTDNISPNNSALSIGNASLYTHGWNGMLSNVMLFNTGLSQSDITTLYNNGNPVTDLSSFSSAVSWWKLNNLTTGIQDSVGSNNGTNSGATKVDTFVSTNIAISSNMTEQSLVNNNVSALNGESSGMDSTNLVTSNISRTQPYSNYSFNFDGATNDYINCTDADIFSFGDGTSDSPFSMSAWIKTTVGTAKGIISKWGTTGTSGYEWIFWVVGPNKIRVNLNDNINTVYQTAQGNTSVNTGEWVHALVTYDGRGGDGSVGANTANQGIKIYVNGVEDTPYSYLNGGGYVAMHNTARIVQLGGYNNAGQFDGQISNAAIFNRVLTEQEILKIYNNGITQDLQAPSTFSNNIVAWWPMDQQNSYFDGTDWIVRDLENGNDGDGANTNNVEDMFGNAPGSEGNGTGSNLAIQNLKGNMYNSDKNAYSINMGDYADGITNPANSGRSTSVP